MKPHSTVCFIGQILSLQVVVEPFNRLLKVFDIPFFRTFCTNVS